MQGDTGVLILLRKQRQAAGDWLHQLYQVELAEGEPGLARDILAARRAVTGAQMFARAVLEETRFLKNRWWEQPRVPAGNPEGGQWTESGGGSGGGSRGGARSFLAPAAGPGWARIPVPAPPVVPAAERRDPRGLPGMGAETFFPPGGGGGGARRGGPSPRTPAPAEPPASAPVGRRGSEMPGQPGNNRPTVIGGRQYSGHALDQMQRRGIPPSAVEDAIRSGEKSTGKTSGTITYYSPSNNLSVITDAETGSVVTSHHGRVTGIKKMATAKDPHAIRMQQAIDDFEAGKIDLGKMMADLDDILNDNPSDRDWAQSVLNYWAVLEEIYAVSLYRGRTELTPEDAAEARQLIDGMKTLIVAKLA